MENQQVTNRSLVSNIIYCNSGAESNTLMYVAGYSYMLNVTEWLKLFFIGLPSHYSSVLVINGQDDLFPFIFGISSPEV